MCPEEGIHAGRVAFKHNTRFAIEMIQAGLCSPANAESPKKFVGLQRGIAQQFGQPPCRDAAIHFHLPQAVLRMDKSERKIRVVPGLRINVRDGTFVADYFDRRVQSAQLDLSCQLGKRLTQVEIARG